LPDGVDRYLDQVAALLRVHPRRRGRVLDELAAHLYESAEVHGEDEALRRIGDPAAVARAFAPRRRDRLWEERDRLAAASMLLAMLMSLPMAADLVALNDRVGHSIRWPALALAPSALVAVASCVLVLARRPLGARLALPLAVLVGSTAVATPAGSRPDGRSAERLPAGHPPRLRDGRLLGPHACRLRLRPHRRGASQLQPRRPRAGAGIPRRRDRLGAAPAAGPARPRGIATTAWWVTASAPTAVTLPESP